MDRGCGHCAAWDHPCSSEFEPEVVVWGVMKGEESNEEPSGKRRFQALGWVAWGQRGMLVISGTPSFGSRALWWTQGPDVLVCAGGCNKVPRLFTLNHRHSFSPSSGARSLRSRCGPGWLLLRRPPWLVGGCLLASSLVSSPGPPSGRV